MSRAIALALVVIIAASGCATADERTTVAPAPVVTAPPVQRGMVLPTWEHHGYQDTASDQALRDISAVGANWVQIVPTWYQSAPRASDMEPTADTAADDDIRHVIRLAHDLGLKVLLKPHLDVIGGSDRARINPADRVAWFESYGRFINHYAGIATELGVEQFAVGTELAALSTDRQPWLGVVAAVRHHYSGQLVYAAHHDEYQKVAFWDAVDIVGIDVYWSLSPRPTVDIAQLRLAFAGRRDQLAAFAARVGRRILFTEAGFPSQIGAATAPWNGDLSLRSAEDEQAAAYDALLSSFTGQPWWAGVFFWTWRVSHQHDIDPPAALDHSIQGKSAQTVVWKWWAPLLGSRAADSADAGRTR